MGQYYHPCVLKKNWKLAKNPVKCSLYSWDYDNGLKLMEHSYVGNNFVMAVMKMIYLSDKDRSGVKFAWVGDYADEVKTRFSEKVDLYSCAWDTIEKENGVRMVSHEKRVKKINDLDLDFKYIINHTKKQYCIIPDFEPEQWIIHPLPILTAYGNGRGGGDYYDKYVTNPEIGDYKLYKYADKHNKKFVGAWAFDRISVSNDENDFEGYKLIDWEIETEM